MRANILYILDCWVNPVVLYPSTTEFHGQGFSGNKASGKDLHLKRFVINMAWGGFESGLNQCNMVNDSSVAYSLFLLLYLSSFE